MSTDTPEFTETFFAFDSVTEGIGYEIFIM